MGATVRLPAKTPSWEDTETSRASRDAETPSSAPARGLDVRLTTVPIWNEALIAELLMRTTHRSLLVVLFATMIASAAAAQSQPPTIPTGLAIALLGWPDARTTTSISVGRAPDGLDAAYIPPAPVTIVGGAAMGSTRSVVLAYPTTDVDALESYSSFLVAHGWNRPSWPARRGGFVSSDDATMRNGWLCRDSLRVTVLPAAGTPAGAKWIKASFYSDVDGQRCGGPMPTGMPRDELEFPTLVAPPGARMLNGSGGGGGGGSRSLSTRLQTTLSIPALLDHYTAQLQKAGWTIGARLVGDGLGMQAVETRDAEGRSWRGALSVITASQAQDIELRMARDGR
jgi:hypothetical protein